MLHFFSTSNNFIFEIKYHKDKLFFGKNYYEDALGEYLFNFIDNIVALSSNPYPNIPFLILFSIYFILLLHNSFSNSWCL